MRAAVAKVNLNTPLYPGESRVTKRALVIGGGIAGAGEIIPRIVQKYYRPDVLPAGADIPFELARLGNDAGMYGSMKLLLDSSDEK